MMSDDPFVLVMRSTLQIRLHVPRSMVHCSIN